VGVFLIGALVGALLHWSVSDMRFSRFLTNTGDPKTMSARISQKYIKEYNLDADEQARIAPLTQQMAQQLYLTRRQFGVDIISILDDYHHRIGEQMSPQHRAIFEQGNVERMKRMSAMLLLDQPAPAVGQK
jgi:hypothetical protein